MVEESRRSILVSVSLQDIANNFAGTLMGIINALGNTMG